jgi:hypothetical protein
MAAVIALVLAVETVGQVLVLLPPSIIVAVVVALVDIVGMVELV